MPRVAIIDYGMGNLFSVQRACEWAGLEASITCDPKVVERSDGIILPGVGAFGDAMAALRSQGLVKILQEAACSDKPFLAICLGMQLLAQRSHEFGLHEGLGILEGEVVRLSESQEGPRHLKVPQVGWNRIHRTPSTTGSSFLEGIPDGAFMYFVHSFCLKPSDPDAAATWTQYGQVRFCSSVERGSLFACQFHPERSGSVGLQVYRNLAIRLREKIVEKISQ